MEFRFIDNIVKISTAEIVGRKKLLESDEIFRDHFPGHPMLPAAMMVECGIQLLQYFSWIQSEFQKTAIALSFDRFKFYQQLKPKDEFLVSLEILPDEIALVESTMRNERVFSGRISFHHFPFSDFHNYDNSKETIDRLSIKNEDNFG